MKLALLVWCLGILALVAVESWLLAHQHVVYYWSARIH